MSIMGWFIVGLASGLIARKLPGETGDGWVANSVLGLLGASIGGGVSCHVFGGDGLGRFNLDSLLMALAGAIVALLLYHLALRRPIA